MEEANKKSTDKGSFSINKGILSIKNETEKNLSLRAYKKDFLLI